MSESGGNDKLYIIIILVMIGCFIYWYQTRLDNSECPTCRERRLKMDTNNDNRLHSKKMRQRSKTNQTQEDYRVRSKSAPKSKSKSKLKSAMKNKHGRKGKSNSKSKKRVTFEEEDDENMDDESDITLDSLDSTDQASLMAPHVRGRSPVDEDDDVDDNDTNESL